ncbi:MAG: hypothetical protein H7Z10_03565, partial [Gemmatimonadaceae bacterium]|nr:hypothetical protein [Acetobacteraceae bacterium]
MRRSVGSDPARLILPALLLALVMPVILMLAILVPLGEVPDEVFHAVRTDSLTHGSVLGRRQARPDGRVPFDAGV